jgi:hypothetical protein
MDGLIELRAHARCCISGDWAIFLDLRRNRYWAAPADALRALSGAAVEPGCALAAFIAAPTLAAHLQALDMIEPKPNADSKHETPHGCARRVWPPRRWVGPQLLDCLHAWTWADRQVREGALDRAVEALSREKARRPLIGAKTPAVAADDLYAYYEARRIWFPAPFVCLFDSLAFAMFAARRGLAVDIVFGVRGRPFAAHCWIECEGRVINDAREYCAAFAPILRA